MKFRNFILSLAALLSFGIVACSSIFQNKNIKKNATEPISLSTHEQAIISKFSEIGLQHNALLLELYGTNTSRRVQHILTDDEISNFFKIDNNVTIISLGTISATRSAEVINTSLVDVMSENDLIDKLAEEYIKRIETVLLTHTGTVEDVHNDITRIEQDGIAALQGRCTYPIYELCRNSKIFS